MMAVPAAPDAYTHMRDVRAFQTATGLPVPTAYLAQQILVARGTAASAQTHQQYRQK